MPIDADGRVWRPGPSFTATPIWPQSASLERQSANPFGALARKPNLQPCEHFSHRRGRERQPFAGIRRKSRHGTVMMTPMDAEKPIKAKRLGAGVVALDERL